MMWTKVSKVWEPLLWIFYKAHCIGNRPKVSTYKWQQQKSSEKHKRARVGPATTIFKTTKPRCWRTVQLNAKLYLRPYHLRLCNKKVNTSSAASGFFCHKIMWLFSSRPLLWFLIKWDMSEVATGFLLLHSSRNKSCVCFHSQPHW
jgi:hypothetical protein